MRTVLLLMLIVSDSKEDLGFGPQDRIQVLLQPQERNVITQPVREFAGGQRMEYVEYAKFQDWINSHKKVHLDFIVPIDREGHGRTSAFLIVYKEQ